MNSIKWNKRKSRLGHTQLCYEQDCGAFHRSITLNVLPLEYKIWVETLINGEYISGDVVFTSTDWERVQEKLKELEVIPPPENLYL